MIVGVDIYRENVTKVLEADGSDCTINDHQIYDWDWTKEGQKLTEQEQGRGVLPLEVMKTDPDAISQDDNGFFLVDYNKLFGEQE